ncbi:MAG: enoyl-CoA hydratase/isomerase family protein [Deltaproteobacteria bacterium]|nr:enoyl-CoA hydratase/isomerase family protein [Deltaproteobacteria bacterium]
MAYQDILFNTQDRIAQITINRPKSLNALNLSLLSELACAIKDVGSNDEIRVLVITGTGEKAFVAGADISELAGLSPLGAKLFSETGHRVMAGLQELPIPVIAAVNGFALGGGLELALSCDFIYASETARFGLPEITLGLIPGFGGTQRLSRLIGKNMAKEMIFTGKMISATEAAKLGIINKICEPDKLPETVNKLAGQISKKGMVSLYAAKHAVNSGFETDLVTGCGIEINDFALCFTSDDAAEGTGAFLEKRKPEFKSRLSG